MVGCEGAQTGACDGEVAGVANALVGHPQRWCSGAVGADNGGKDGTPWATTWARSGTERWCQGLAPGGWSNVEGSGCWARCWCQSWWHPQWYGRGLGCGRGGDSEEFGEVFEFGSFAGGKWG